MRKAEIFVKGVPAGILTELEEGGFEFVYDDRYMSDKECPSVSLTLPKNAKTHKSDTMFPVFFNILSEGANRFIQCRTLKIDENDPFGLLLATAGSDTIGAITVIEIP